MLSELPPELLYLISLCLRTTASDCSDFSLTCWNIHHAAAPALFKSIRILDQSPAEDLPNLTSLRLDINTAPLLCWMVQLDGLFLALNSGDITNLELKITDWVDAHHKQMPAIGSKAPVPYHCLPNLAVLRITISVGNTDSSRKHQWPWLSYFDTLIVASKATLTTLSLNIHHNDGAFITPLARLKRLEILQAQRIDLPRDSQAHLDAALALAQPDVCPALHRIDWNLSGLTCVVDVTRGTGAGVVVSRASPTPWVPWKCAQSWKEYMCLVAEDLPSDSDSDDLEYEPPLSSSGDESDSDSECEMSSPDE
ncbi:hypothetical protein CCMSSC00406_0008192 [Pleurotus cornucopiae]|uniref:Uncharacterized protein n=1 Tax=Pleurotus cornucopiae TaxID=5321 RepID=A0ACB7IP23_PLECO|nr:hypothetical protein CCMSSC00406_0008192 [Pleurotus cornucopiae]